MQLNWGAGLFRLWLMASVLWWAAAGWLCWDDYQNSPQLLQYEIMPPELCKEMEAGPSGVDLAAIAKCEKVQKDAIKERRQTIGFLIGLPLLPPFIVLGFGFAFMWVARGFMAKS